MARLTAVLTLAFVLGAVPSVAAASTVEVDPTTGRIVFVGGSGTNDVTEYGLSGGSFTDAAQELIAGPGCVANGEVVVCSTFQFGADVSLDGGDDRYRGFSYFPIAVTGGTGADRIRVSGDQSRVSGGSGADWISVGSNGTEVVDGDSGDDNIRTTDANLGYATTLSGGSGHDLVYGEPRGQTRGLLSGEAGNDSLIVTSGNTVTGGAGEDVLLVVGSSSSFRGPSTLNAGDDADTIVGGRSTDTVSGGAGDDVIDVSGDPNKEYYLPDTVDCGPGNDAVYADPDDVIADSCENRLDGPMPQNKRIDAALARLVAAFGVTAAD